jgi:hypothetical protein
MRGLPLHSYGRLLPVEYDMNEIDDAEIKRFLRSEVDQAALVAVSDFHNVDDVIEIRRLKAEVLTLRERIAFLESPEVCAAAHDDVQECGYCQRDRYYPGYIRYEYLRTLSVRAIANLWASSFMPSGLPLDEMVDRARAAPMKFPAPNVNE